MCVYTYDIQRAQQSWLLNHARMTRQAMVRAAAAESGSEQEQKVKTLQSQVPAGKKEKRSEGIAFITPSTICKYMDVQT